MMEYQEYIDNLPPDERAKHDARAKELHDEMATWPKPAKDFWKYMKNPHLCPNKDNHRGPEGPNEDIGTCHQCNSFSFSMRPENETWGSHLSDCSLPRGHQRYCVGGGAGHFPSEIERG